MTRVLTQDEVNKMFDNAINYLNNGDLAKTVAQNAINSANKVGAVILGVWLLFLLSTVVNVAVSSLTISLAFIVFSLILTKVAEEYKTFARNIHKKTTLDITLTIDSVIQTCPAVQTDPVQTDQP